MIHTYHITGMTCNGCVATVKQRLEKHPDVTQADVSLEEGKVNLSMAKHIPAVELQALLGAGKYAITAGESETPTMVRDSGEPVTGFFQRYKPLLLIAAYLLVVALVTSWSGTGIDLHEAMRTFMAGFFLVFSFFKFLDLRGFAESYGMYDLLAMRWKAYGFIYPFIELGLGIAYLTAFNPVVTYAATIVVMGFSSIGVIRSVVDNRAIKCACLGTVFDLPMTTVTIIEDLLMVAMAGVMWWMI